MTTDDKVTVAVGERVIVSDHRRDYFATVRKVGRVWIEIERDDWSRLERFRLDTRTPYARGKGHGSAPYFFTLAEHAERRQRAADLAYLRMQGVSIDHGTETTWTPHTLAVALNAMSDVPKLLGLIEEYGNECTAGGAGYTVDDSDKILNEIKELLTGEGVAGE